MSSTRIAIVIRHTRIEGDGQEYQVTPIKDFKDAEESPCEGVPSIHLGRYQRELKGVCLFPPAQPTILPGYPDGGISNSAFMARADFEVSEKKMQVRVQICLEDMRPRCTVL